MAKSAPDPKRVAEILAAPTASIPDTGYCLNLGRDSSYNAAKRGEIKVIKIGSLKRVPTAWIRRMLDLEAVAQ